MSTVSPGFRASDQIGDANPAIVEQKCLLLCIVFRGIVENNLLHTGCGPFAFPSPDAGLFSNRFLSQLAIEKPHLGNDFRIVIAKGSNGEIGSPGKPPEHELQRRCDIQPHIFTRFLALQRGFGSFHKLQYGFDLLKQPACLSSWKVTNRTAPEE